jgi:phosphoribosylformylglycinamidine cyclo-ligase
MGYLNYKKSGVNIETGNRFVNQIKPIAKQIQDPAVISGIGGFAACYELPIEQYKQPILVSATDGVGTKLRLAIKSRQHSTVGIDLVAMCVNDVLCAGAKPLYFLDYYATSEIDLETSTTIIKSIVDGCKMANISLIGGETAEMPGHYATNDYDLAGFCVGIVEKNMLLNKNKISIDDLLIAIGSSGFHANGFSLIREIIKTYDLKISPEFLTPTKIYTKSMLPLLNKKLVLSAAHITGGGLTDNIPRILPDFTNAIIDTSTWQFPKIFAQLQRKGKIQTSEMYQTFNCGVGMILCVKSQHAQQVLTTLKEGKETAWIIGHIQHSKLQTPSIQFV